MDVVSESRFCLETERGFNREPYVGFCASISTVGPCCHRATVIFFNLSRNLFDIFNVEEGLISSPLYPLKKRFTFVSGTSVIVHLPQIFMFGYK